MMKRYIKLATGGDRYMGYLLSGRDPLGREWLKLPPYFCSELLDSTVRAAFCGSWLNDENFTKKKGMLSFLIASAVHHAEFFDAMLPDNAPLLQNFVFASRERLLKLRALLPSGNEWYEDKRKLISATARTPWSTVLSRIDKLESKIDGSTGSTHVNLEVSERLKRIEELLEKNGTNPTATDNATVFVHGVKQRELLLPKSFMKRSKKAQAANMKATFALFWLGNSRKKFSPLRYVETRQTTAHKDPTMARYFKNMKRACDLLSAHIAFNHPELWKAFCEDPSDFRLNEAFTAGFHSIRPHVKKRSRATSSSTSKKRKRNWNTMAPNTFEDQTKEYNRELRAKHGIGKRVMWIESGQFQTPPKSLVMKVGSVVEAETPSPVTPDIPTVAPTAE